MKKRKPIVRTILACLFLIITIALNMAYSSMSSIIDSYAGLLTAKDEETVSVTDDLTGTDLADQLTTEGAVLLKNEDNTLPLPGDVTKVNVFGWASTQWQGGGSGSGGVSSVNVDLIQALNAYGIETNTELQDMYTAFQKSREAGRTLGSTPEVSGRLYEPSVTDSEYYTEELLSNALAYSDTAIVVVGRFIGESNDATKKQYKVTKSGGDVICDETRSLLELSTEEEELLAYVGQNYDKVILMINSGNIFELGQVETLEGVDAVVMAGMDGSDGTEALPALLYGEENFSGKTVDTWAYDMSTAASWANTGEDGVGAYSDADGLYPADGTTNGNLGLSGEESAYTQVSYEDYAESIYVGYKWYETADAEGYWDYVSNEYGEGYDGVVQFPFGYGLSYTSFEWEVVDSCDGAVVGTDDTISVTVKVTNTGDTAGKDVVELYYAAPYIKGEIEKSAKNLGAFAKTDLLEPGESQELTLTLDVEDMASYDCYDANNNGFAGYELDPGDYVITLQKDAHHVSPEDGMTMTVSIAENIQYDTASNKFTGDDAIDGFSLDGSDSEQNITYLTRADFAGTFPAENVDTRAMTAELAEKNLYTEVDAEAWIDEADEAITTGADNGLSVVEDGQLTELGYKLGTDYEAEEWDALLDQLTIDEMLDAVSHGYSHIKAMDSVGKPATTEQDGPSQIGGFLGAYLGISTTTGFPSASTNACTWNAELINNLGRAIGREAAGSGINGIYGPSTNIHRSPLNGRNFEYYSEDGFLSGIYAGNYVSGAKDAGTYCFIKHLINNDGEAYIYRDSVYIWETEQALREIYLKPFEIAIKEYGATGVMSSYNRIGSTWSGGSEALLKGVLREEWNFCGAVITDYADHQQFMNGDQMIRAGGDIWMDGFTEGELTCETESNSFRQALRTAAKHIIYQYCNAMAANQDYVAATGDESMVNKTADNSGSGLVKGILIALDILSAIFLLLVIRRWIKCRNKAK